MLIYERDKKFITEVDENNKEQIIKPLNVSLDSVERIGRNSILKTEKKHKF